jgi:hypothetical protein
MTKFAKMLVAPAFIFAAACGGSDDENRMDDALSKDLALAASVQPYQPQQFMSPYEMQYGAQYPQGYYQQPMYPQAPVYQRVNQGGYYPAPAPAPRPAPTVRRTSSTGTVAREPVVVRRNTKRDAIIGATAGAAIGAVTSRDRLKGAVIGAVAGGVLGGVIGHTVDVERQ